MSETLSHKFIDALFDARDELYERSLARWSSAAQAEAGLQQAARGVFNQYGSGQVHDIPVGLRQALEGGEVNRSGSGTTVVVASAMPADVWARLTAAIQIEAARSTHEAALNKDSVLLSPDPLLAPKTKSANPADDEGHSFSARQMVLGGAIAIVLGLAITVYLVTRPSVPRHPAHLPTTQAPSP